jgi:hypothetical protein
MPFLKQGFLLGKLPGGIDNFLLKPQAGRTAKAADFVSKPAAF